MRTHHATIGRPAPKRPRHTGRSSRRYLPRPLTHARAPPEPLMLLAKSLRCGTR